MRWLLLRGLSREARHWGEFPRQLRAAFPGARIETADLPGNGARCRERSPASVVGLTEAVRRSLGTEKVERVHLLGLSLGALVCTDWARRYPGEVAACVLVNASVRPFSAFHKRLRPRNYPGLIRAFCASRISEREAIVLGLTSNRPVDGVLPAWAAYATERPVARMNVLRQLLAAARYRAPSRAPQVPVLVLASAGDRLVDPACSAALAARWRAPMAVHPSAGHDLALDDGPWLAAEIRRWLGGLA